MPNSSTNFNDLPHKAHIKIFQNLAQNEQQRNREVCKKWNRIVNEEFPVELTITNTNYERLFKCEKAKKVIISSLTSEYMGTVGFGDTIRNLEVTGKVLSSNIIKILKSCPKLESVLFSALKQVLGIDTFEAFELPKLTSLEIKVRPDQETFTSDEMILINTLKKGKFASLQTITISVRNFMVWGDEDDDDFDENSEGFTLDQSRNDIELPTDVSEESTTAYSRAPYPSLELQPNPIDTQHSAGGLQTSEHHDEFIRETVSNDQERSGSQLHFSTEVHSNTEVSATIIRPLLTDASTGRTASTSEESTYSRIGINEFEFATRMLNTRLQRQIRNSQADLDSFLNDPTSGVDFSYRPNALVNSNDTGLKTTVFFELMSNNGEHLRSFIVKARPDFMCFGNISSLTKDLNKIQLEDVEYSFGRSQKLCLEFMLLQVQSKLCRIKVHILDDMWESVMIATDKSKETMSEMDLKILSLSEDSLDLVALSRCKTLKVLKLFHFFEKESLNILPISLEKLVLNGPVSKADLKTFTQRLHNLIEFTLILNTQKSEKIDKSLFKEFTLMPKIAKLVFIQSHIDVNDICAYCNENPGLIANVQGPKELSEPFSLSSSIQYVIVNIDTHPSVNIDLQLIS